MSVTASTVPKGVQRTTASVGVSFGDRSSDGPIETPTTVIDVETRVGINEHSDAGLRITSVSGAVLSYKRRLLGATNGAALSAQLEGGLVKGGRLAMGGLSVLASSADGRRNAVFGGVRYLPVAPLHREVKREIATIGGFLGVQLCRGAIVMLPELGVFRGYDDKIANRARWFIIPTFSLTRRPRRAETSPR